MCSSDLIHSRAKLRAMMPWSEEGKAQAAGDGAPARERAGAAAAG